jgi:hypothetical protein
MLHLKSSSHLRTGRFLRSFRAGPTSTGLSRAPAEWMRLYLEEAALARREGRRRWLARGWGAHLRACRRLREGAPWVMS